MHKKAIVHLMTKARMKTSSFTAEIDAMEELSEKYWIKNVIYYKWDTIEYIDLLNKLKKFWILLHNYSNKEDLKEQVIEFNKQYEIIYIWTPMEFLVNIVNEIKVSFGRPISDYPDIFRNKHLQRELIQKYNPELGIKFSKWIPEELNINEIEKEVGYPFIIKPVDWVQSAWVVKINNKKEFNNYIEHYKVFHDRLKSRWVDSKLLIVEEFIEWKLYSIDYFVSDEWIITISKPVKVRLWVDLWIKDYFNFARIVSEKTENEFKWKRLKTFVNSTVKATWIKNSFVHHEFKINSKWEFKTIELNWRIWWWRLEIMQIAYGINLFEFIVNPETKIWNLKESIITIKVYSQKKWILESFNDKLFEKIEKKESVFEIIKDESHIWKEVWLTSDWFTNVATIKLKSKDYKILRKDYTYVKKYFNDLLIVDQDKNELNIKDTWLFNRLKWLFNN